MSGEVDLCTAPLLAEELGRVQQAGIDVIVDLEQVEFMDCAGLRVLLRFASTRIAASARFSVTPGTPQVQRLFQLSGIGSLLRVTPRRGALRVDSYERKNDKRTTVLSRVSVLRRAEPWPV